MPDPCPCNVAGCNGATFDKLIRHAQLYGSLDEVYACAEEHRWEAADLSRLAISLRQVDKTWKLPDDAKLRLTDRMLNVGMDPGRICMAVGLSSKSLQSLIDRAQSPAKAPLAPRKRGKAHSGGNGQAQCCRACGTALTGRRMDARFCNATCRKSAFRKARSVRSSA